MYIYTRRERARAAFLHKSIVVRSDGCKRESIQDGEINVLEKKKKKKNGIECQMYVSLVDSKVLF